MNNKKWDSLWMNAQLTMFCDNECTLLTNGALAVTNGNIAWLGAMSDLKEQPRELANEVFDVQGCLITPGLIDCHTHIVFAGNRSDEFARRLRGESYADIARAGGGIHATVMATRKASFDELLEQTLPRVQALIAEGVTTIEIKSGYGLDVATELKILRVARRIGEILPITVRTTFLGAHALPAEYQGRQDAYIDFVCHEMLPAIAAEKLADSVDVFCEMIGFDLAQTERVFAAAAQQGLTIKCHADQLSNMGASTLAANYGALSVDHLEHLTLKDIEALSKSGTVAVLLPGAFYFLRETQKPPIDLLRQFKIPMAVATDCNPGTSPCTSLLLMMNMASVLFGLSPHEALLGVTQHAAKALGLADTHGVLAVGYVADFVVWGVKDPSELVYRMGMNSIKQRVCRGNPVF